MRKKIIFLYYIKKELTRGRTYFYNLFDFLSNNFDLTIYTNKVAFLQSLDIKANFVQIPEIGKVPFFSYIFYNYQLNKIIASDTYDILISCHYSHILIKDTKIIFVWLILILFRI